jgi:hypothetical protein
MAKGQRRSESAAAERLFQSLAFGGVGIGAAEAGTVVDRGDSWASLSDGRRKRSRICGEAARVLQQAAADAPVGAAFVLLAVGVRRSLRGETGGRPPRNAPDRTPTV